MFTISLDKIEVQEKEALPFSAIKIVDARFDKSNIGCAVKNFSFKGMTRNKLNVVFPGSLQTYLPIAIDKAAVLNKSSKDTMMMLVKQFRLADHLFNTLDAYHTPETVLTFSVSFYKKEGNQLVRLFSLADTWSKAWNNVKGSDENEINAERNNAIIALLSQLFQNRVWTPTATTFSWADLEAGLKKRFGLPVFTDSLSRAGLYKNFNEFINNSPSVINVQMKMRNNELTDVLDAENHTVDLRDYWGACDGKNRYIIFKGAFNKLLPTDSSFRFLSDRQEAKVGGLMSTRTKRLLLWGPVITNAIKGSGTRANQEYFYLNMENGRVHLEEVTGTQPYEIAIKSLNNAAD